MSSRLSEGMALLVSAALLAPPSIWANSASYGKLSEAFNGASKNADSAASRNAGSYSGGSHGSSGGGSSLPPGAMHSNHSGGYIVQHGNGSLTHTVNGVTNTYHPPVRTDNPLTTDYQALKAQRDKDLAEQAEKTKLRNAENERLAEERRLADQKRAEEKARQEQKKLVDEKRLADERHAEQKQQEQALERQRAEEKARQEQKKLADEKRLADERRAEQKRQQEKASQNLPAVYDPQFAARQRLGGANVTPGGRTVTDHAAERMTTPTDGKRQMSMKEVDKVLDEGNVVKVRKNNMNHPEGPTVIVQNTRMAGMPEVVVDQATGKRIVTVMQPNSKKTKP